MLSRAASSWAEYNSCTETQPTVRRDNRHSSQVEPNFQRLKPRTACRSAPVNKAHSSHAAIAGMQLTTCCDMCNLLPIVVRISHRSVASGKSAESRVGGWSQFTTAYPRNAQHCPAVSALTRYAPHRTCLSRRPGRRSAGSIKSGRLDAAITNTICNQSSAGQAWCVEGDRDFAIQHRHHTPLDSTPSRNVSS